RPLPQLFSRLGDTDFRFGTVLRTIVPGLAQRYRGRPERANIFLYGYIALLVPGLLLLGTMLGSIFLGLAFSMHVASAADALVGKFSRLEDRLAFTLVCAAALGLALYYPIGRAV